ncbi:uteroglobin [Equus caballus]
MHISLKTTGSRDTARASLTSLLSTMKLAIIVTLAILALCCSPASAEICQSFADIIQGLFLGTPASFEAAVEPFKPDADMKAATTQLKTLVDFLPKNTKDSILKLMDKIAKSPLCA